MTTNSKKKAKAATDSSIREIEEKHYKRIYLLVSAITFLFAASMIVYFMAPANGGYVSSCLFASGATCNSLILSSNASSGKMSVIIKNSRPYTILAPQMQISINNTVFNSTACSPYVVSEGGSIICNVTISQNAILSGSLLSGTIYLSDKPCQDGNVLDCQNTTTETDTGNFTTEVASTPSLTNVVLSLNAENITQSTGLGKDPITANVKFLGVPLAMDVVNFTVNGTATISPDQSRQMPMGRRWHISLARLRDG